MTASTPSSPFVDLSEVTFSEEDIKQARVVLSEIAEFGEWKEATSGRESKLDKVVKAVLYCADFQNNPGADYLADELPKIYRVEDKRALLRMLIQRAA